MKRILALGCLVIDAFARRSLARRPAEGEPESLNAQIRTIAIATTTVRGAKRYLIWRVVFTLVIISALVPLIIFLNDKGIAFTHPARARSKMTEESPMVATVAGIALEPHPDAKMSENAQGPTATEAAPPPTATATPGASDVPALLSGVLNSTADTVTDATSTLSQLLTAEADGAVATWCSLATALDSGPCDTAILAEWSSPHAQPGAATASPEIVAVGQPSGNASQYTYNVRFDTSTVQVTMVWDGRNWRLSEPDYQKALNDGGILAPLGALTSAVLDLT
jgi:hypothetical protein